MPSVVPADESFKESDVPWPKTRLATPVKKMKQRIDASVVSLTTEAWELALKEKPLRTNLRVARQTQSDLLQSEFQLLINMANQHVAQLEALIAFQVAAKALNSDRTIDNIKAISKVLEESICPEVAKLTAKILHCELYVLQVFIDICDVATWAA